MFHVNHRQQIDGSMRAHKKQMSSLQSTLTDYCISHASQFQSKSPSKCLSEVDLLEQGKLCVMCKTSHTYFVQDITRCQVI